MHYLRIWNDAEGESHFEEVRRPVRVQAAEPGVAALHLADPVPVDRAQFLELDGDAQDPDWHTAPRRQFVVFLDGWVRIEVSDGDVAGWRYEVNGSARPSDPPPNLTPSFTALAAMMPTQPDVSRAPGSGSPWMLVAALGGTVVLGGAAVLRRRSARSR